MPTSTAPTRWMAEHRPVVIAHRGASGYRPEHTVGSYLLAIEMGADFIEPDLCSTSDGALVARHENVIDETTDVADHPEFAGRRTTKTIDGRVVTGWFTEDFTLAEIKTLRARERLPRLRPASAAFDGRFEIPTFGEILDLAAAEAGRRGRPVGVYPETKHPSWFASIGLAHAEPLLAALRGRGLAAAGVPVLIQSFEDWNLRELAPRLAGLAGEVEVRQVQLFGTEQEGDRFTTPAGLADVATYAAAIGPDIARILPPDGHGDIGAPTALVADAHAAGLHVHPWTVRAENHFLPSRFRAGDDAAAHGDADALLRLLFDQGVDGVFSDFPDLAVAARRRRA